MRWVRQIAATEDCCGQCCVAMLLGIGKREAIRRMGHDDGTTTTEMRRALRRGGLRVGARMTPFRGFDRIPTPLALLLGFWKKYPHWMVWNAGRVFDPVEGIVTPRRGKLPKRYRVTHHLWVE